MTPLLPLLVLVIRLVLSAVFALAGATKLLDRPGSRAAMINFGVSERWASLAASMLAASEIVIALLLLPSSTAWFGAVGALALLVLFIVQIGINLAQGRTPDCHCFGQLYSRPIGRETLVRNGILALLALFLVLQGPQGIRSLALSQAALPEGSTLWIALAVLLLAVGAAVGVLGLFMFNLLRQNGRLMLRVEALERAAGIVGAGEEQAPAGLPVGTPAPAFQLPTIQGQIVNFADLFNTAENQGKPILLHFSDPGCGPCRNFLPQIAEWQQKQSRFNVVVASTGAPTTNLQHASEYGIENMLLQQDREVAQLFGVRATPGALLIDAQGRIASPVALGPEAIRTLVQERENGGKLRAHLARGAATERTQQGNNGARGGPSIAPVAQLGNDAPVFQLADLEGAPHALEDFKGDTTLLLFWNPDCGYCQRMLPKLREWEARGVVSPRLVLLSAGRAEAHQPDALDAPVLLDSGFRIGRTYGIQGTPSALLVDAQGKVASEVAVGEPAIVNLLFAGDPLKLTAVNHN